MYTNQNMLEMIKTLDAHFAFNERDEAIMKAHGLPKYFTSTECYVRQVFDDGEVFHSISGNGDTPEAAIENMFNGDDGFFIPMAEMLEDGGEFVIR